TPRLTWAGIGRRAEMLEQHNERHEEYRDGYRQRHHSRIVGDQQVDLARCRIGVAVFARLAFEPGNRPQRQLDTKRARACLRLRQYAPDDVEAPPAIINRDNKMAVGCTL